MRALIPVLSALATVAGAFVASYLNARRRASPAGSRTRAEAATRMAVSVIVTVALCAIAVAFTIAVLF